MTEYFEAPDGHGEPCLWMPTDNGPWCLLRKSDVAGTDRWPDVVARMTGTTVTADDATVERIARCLYEFSWEGLGGASWDDHPTADNKDGWRTEARAILAALTGVPHDR